MKRSYLFDFEKGDFVVKDGKLIECDGIEAIKVWIEKILRTEKGRFAIFDDTDYGCHIEDLIVVNNESAVDGFDEESDEELRKRYFEKGVASDDLISEVKNHIEENRPIGAEVIIESAAPLVITAGVDKFENLSIRNKIFREVCANLLIHREFSSAYPAKLIIENDRVCTENANKPHGFGLIDSNNFSPFPKNPAISKFFREIGYADELGSGIRNINKYLEVYSGGKPEEINEGINPIFTWTANWTNVWTNRKTEDMLVLVNNTTRFVVAVYQVKKKDLKNIEKIIIDAIEHTLLAMNLNPEIVKEYLRQCGSIEFIKNSSRTATSWVTRAGHLNYVFNVCAVVNNRNVFCKHY